jgi:uncharacterized ferritin-like protein (DUF455 family)
MRIRSLNLENDLHVSPFQLESRQTALCLTRRYASPDVKRLAGLDIVNNELAVYVPVSRRWYQYAEALQESMRLRTFANLLEERDV